MTTASLDPEITCNLGHNICELYNVLVQIRSTTGKTKRGIFTISNLIYRALLTKGLARQQRNIFLKNRNEESKINYNKQRNLCVILLRKSKREYYQNLSVENICDKKKFWKVVKPLVSNKIMSSEKITLAISDTCFHQ